MTTQTKIQTATAPTTAAPDRFSEFLNGFARGADIDRAYAWDQWVGWSRQLSDSTREKIERDGEDGGFSEGQWFAKLQTSEAAQ